MMYEVEDVYTCNGCDDEVEMSLSGEINAGMAMLTGNCPVCGHEIETDWVEVPEGYGYDPDSLADQQRDEDAWGR